MAKLGIETGADLAAKDIAWLRAHFGSFADYLYRAARGIDLRPVRASRIRKSVGGERTFSEDISSGPALRETLESIIDIVWGSIDRAGARGRTVTLKLKYTDFQIMSRARTVPAPIADRAAFSAIARELLDEVLPLPMPIRLMGLTLSKLEGDGAGAEAERPPDGQLSLL
jgi:DNA polymerase IV